MLRAIYLDRDGVINNAIVRDGLPYSPRRVEEFVISEGSLEFCEALKSHGFILIVATNQPDVGRGIVAKEVIERMHALMCERLPIDHVEVCYSGGHELIPDLNRKPLPGMLINTAVNLGIDLNSSWMVGDRWRDVACGKAAGCRTVFIDYGYSEELVEKPDFIVTNLDEAKNAILREADLH